MAIDSVTEMPQPFEQARINLAEGKVSQFSFGEAQKAFTSIGQGSPNDAARAALPAISMGGCEIQTGSISNGQTQSEQLLKSPLEDKGWTKGGSGNFYKDTPLPKDWDSMSPEQKKAWSKAQMDDPDLSFTYPGKRELITGRHVDPITGEHIWIGWAGESPSESDQKWLREKNR